MNDKEMDLLNNIIYRLYDGEDFFLMQKNLLKQLNLLIPFSFGSIILSDKNNKLGLTEPVCFPEEFVSIERKYIKIIRNEALFLDNYFHDEYILCESKNIPGAKRFDTQIYQSCYKSKKIHDCLQLKICYDNYFLGIIKLYRTKYSNTFSDTDIKYLKMISKHINRLFYNSMITGNTKERIIQRAHALQKDYSLTPRETELLIYLLEGISDEEIMKNMSIVYHTFRKHLQHIYYKLSISSRWSLIRFK